MSIFKVKAVVEVDSYDLAKYLGEKIGKEVEILGNNDSVEDITVKKGEIRHRWTKETLERILASGVVDLHELPVIMYYAVDNDWVVEGEYLVSFSW